MIGRGLIVLIFWLSAQIIPALADGPCDPGLIQDKTNPVGYRLRGDRCEGIYIQEVAGSPLTLASWTEAFQAYDLASDAALAIGWNAPTGKSVHLRAQSTRRRLYFRMDASPSGSSFSWPPSLLAAIQIPKSDLGVTGTYIESVNGEKREVLAPLRIGQKQVPGPAGVYELVIVPGVELKEVFLTLSGAERTNGGAIKNGEPLRYGYYPAERPVVIPISGMSKAGIYHLQIGSTLAAGGASTLDLWFYHSGK